MSQIPYQPWRIILLTLLAALILSILPLPEVLRVFRPHWVALTVIYWCFAAPLQFGILAAWVVGLLMDALHGTLFGQQALCLVIISYLTIETRRRLLMFPAWQQALTVASLLLVERLLNLWIIGLSGQPTPSLWYWASAGVGMLCWPLLSWVLARWSRPVIA